MSKGPTRQPTSEPTGDTVGLESVPLSQADRAILSLEGPTIAGHICKVIRLGPRHRLSEASTPVTTRTQTPSSDTTTTPG